MLKEREKVIQARTPAPKRTVAGGKPVLSHRDVKQGVEIHRVNIDSIFFDKQVVKFHRRKRTIYGTKSSDRDGKKCCYALCRIYKVDRLRGRTACSTNRGELNNRSIMSSARAFEC